MSIPLRRQKTLSIVSVISFPSPPFSSIRSQTSLEAFSRTGFLHSHKSVKNALVFTFFFLQTPSASGDVEQKNNCKYWIITFYTVTNTCIF